MYTSREMITFGLKLLPLSSGWFEDIRSKLHQKVLSVHQTIKWIKIHLNFDNFHANTEVSQTVFKNGVTKWCNVDSTWITSCRTISGKFCK